MLRTVLLPVLALALGACGAAPRVAPSHARPTAEVLIPTAGPSAPAVPTAAPLSPAYQAAPGLVLAATAAVLMDTPVLEPTPAPTAELAPTAEPAPAPSPAAPAEIAAAAAPRAVTRIEIDAIGLDRSPVEVSVDTSGAPFVPKHDVAWFGQSAVPGEGENIVLWGHALRFRDSPDVPAPFGQLSRLAPGDRIVLTDAAGGTRAYRVAEQVWATPDQVSYILPTGRERLTLVSCIGDRVVTERGVTMSHRLITIAEPEA